MTAGYIDVTNHSLTYQLESNYEHIKKEFENLRKTLGEVKKINTKLGPRQNESYGKMFYEGEILNIFINIVSDSSSPTENAAALKIDYTERKKLSPTLLKIMTVFEHRGTLGSVGFNIMRSPATLNMHFGMIDKYVRFHLCLYGDSTSKFHIKGEESKSWVPGKVWAFDDGLAFHGTTHTSYNERVILIFDINKSEL